MNTVERSFRLEAQSGLGAKPRPELIGPVLTHLHDTLQDTVRMGFLHTSRARGRISASIKAAADVRYLGHSAEGDDVTVLRFEVAPFGKVAADLFSQTQLWEDGPQPEETAFELLAAALEDVGSRRGESSRFDPGMLRRIGSYRKLFGKDGLSSIVLPDVTLHKSGRLDAAVVQSARELTHATPQPRRVRVAGRLDLMGASQGVLKLHVATGGIVTAIWEGEEALEQFAPFFNKDVVCEGLGVFRPSGTLLRIDADALAPASERDEFFRYAPVAEANTDLARSARLRSGEPSVYSSFLGSIPPEESDEEFAAAVDALS
jgi:hypothetical protein